MFSPEGYIPWHQMLGSVQDMASRLILAHELQKVGRDPQKAFTLEHVVVNHFPSYPKGRSKRIEFLSNFLFEEEILSVSILADVIMMYPPKMCSPTGVIMEMPPQLGLHLDRLHYSDWQLPVKSTPTFEALFRWFDEGHRVKLLDRFAFIEESTGLIGEKNMSKSFLLNSSSRAERDTVDRIIRDLVHPFTGWAIAWKASDLPVPISSILWGYGAVDHHWLPEETRPAEVKLPRSRKFPQAFSAFAAMGFKRGDRTWKQVINEIGRQTDEWPDESTYRSWAREHDQASS